MPRPRIAVVGMDCHYPDAASPEQLWENVLAGRRAFRRLPDERMRQTDYYSPDPAAPDRFYTTKAAVIEGYEFDRVAYRVAGSTYRSTDLAHWLALDTASGALADAGFPKGDGLADRAVGVVIGNSLNGEFSRANLMRLRWPYVRRTVATALREHGWADGELVGFLDHLEERYKSPFPPIDEDSLAGGLANTIAGRICNHYDFKGGGFTVDGACSSSLLSVAVACDALADGRLDVAIVGGVDLSIDPFEVIGFAKTGALATGEMRVYDRGSNGFWPGEGCGMFVLMRDGDAVAEHRPRHATIAGWAYSSDGKGGITRPEADGHRLALSRAYAAAGFGIDTVAYLEGHGTGTAVGDATELRAFSAERRAADPDAPAAAISTVKGNFGHTKAAAGAAGLLKAVLAVRHQVIPPATSHVDPHPELTGENPALYVPDTARLWPADAPIRAGVSSMGFGGINAHVIVEHADGARRVGLGRVTERLVRSRQDAELLLLDADSPAGLRELAASLAALTARLSYAELADLAATLHQRLAGRPIRAAVVASTPEEAEQRLGKLITMLDNGARSMFAASDGVFLGARGAAPRIGLLFPGQGAGRHGDGGAVRRRFASVDELYRDRRLPVEGDLVATAVAQPRIVTSSIAGLRVLSDLGVEAVGAVGHSLGELTALHWAGAMDEATALDLSAARGELMQRLGVRGGSMAGVAAEPAAVERLLAGEDVVIAGYNGPRQTVISGPADAVARVGALAAAKGIGVSGIAVSHAFHSTAMAPAALALGARLERERFGPPARRVVSSVTGDTLPADVDVPALLTRQLLDPVRFADAVGRLAADVDLLVEVGPGRVLAGLVGDIAPQVPVISLDTDSRSLSGPLRAIAAAYALGAPVRHSALFEDRLTRPLPLDKEFRFFVSPCETVPDDRLPAAPGRSDAAPERSDGAPGAAPEPVRPPNQGTAIDGTGTAGPGATPGGTEPAGSLEVLLRLAAERAELPLAAVRPEANPLDELHLSSITVGQIVGQASRELGITAPMATTAFATSTLGDLAAMLDELAGTSLAKDVRQPDAVEGVAPWVRAFSIELVKAEAGRPSAHAASTGEWRLFAPERHPLAGALAAALRGAGLGGGVLLCLPRDAGEDELGRMLGAAHAALATDGPSRFVVVGDRRSAGGLAKTLHLETPRIATSVIRLPLPDDMTQRQVTEAAARIVADVAATAGFTEVDYDAAGTRRVPVLRPLPPGDATATSGPLGPGDVILVTGGGKGITAECALSLGRDSGAAVGLVGRSDPDTDPELAANLERMAAAGVTYHYVAADITSEAAARAAVRRIRDRLGPVTAVLHGAGRNVPQPLATLDEATFRRTLAPKIAGLEAVLAAVDPDSLRLLVTFGSIIGRAGLRGGRLRDGQRMAHRADLPYAGGASDLPVRRPRMVGLVGQRHGGAPRRARVADARGHRAHPARRGRGAAPAADRRPAYADDRRRHGSGAGAADPRAGTARAAAAAFRGPAAPALSGHRTRRRQRTVRRQRSLSRRSPARRRPVVPRRPRHGGHGAGRRRAHRAIRGSRAGGRRVPASDRGASGRRCRPQDRGTGHHARHRTGGDPQRRDRIPDGPLPRDAALRPAGARRHHDVVTARRIGPHPVAAGRGSLRLGAVPGRPVQTTARLSRARRDQLPRGHRHRRAHRVVRRVPARRPGARRSRQPRRAHARAPVLRTRRDAAAGGCRTALARRPSCGGERDTGRVARRRAAARRRHVRLRPRCPRSGRTAGRKLAGTAAPGRPEARRIRALGSAAARPLPGTAHATGAVARTPLRRVAGRAGTGAGDGGGRRPRAGRRRHGPPPPDGRGARMGARRHRRRALPARRQAGGRRRRGLVVARCRSHVRGRGGGARHLRRRGGRQPAGGGVDRAARSRGFRAGPAAVGAAGRGPVGVGDAVVGRDGVPAQERTRVHRRQRRQRRQRATTWSLGPAARRRRTDRHVRDRAARNRRSCGVHHHDGRR